MHEFTQFHTSLQEERVAQHCLHLCIRNMSIDNAIPMLIAADQYKVEVLPKNAFGYITVNIKVKYDIVLRTILSSVVSY